MPDLSPDASLLIPRQQAGLGNMDLGSLLGMAQRARELQTQSGISDALKASVNPQTGQPDPTAAMGRLVKDPSVYLGPEHITAMTHAQEAQTQLNHYYMGEAGKAVSSLITTPGGATVDQVTKLTPLLRSYGVPSSMITDVLSSVSPDGKHIDQNRLATLRNWIADNGGIDTRNVQTPGGRTVSMPTGSTFYGTDKGGAPSGATPPGAAAGTVTTAIPGAPEVGAKSSLAFGEARDRSTGYTQEVYPLKAVIHALEEGGDRATGEGSEAYNTVNNFLHYAGIDKKFGFDTTKQTVDYETARKYMIQWANTVSAAGTNDRLAAAIAGNPNMKMLQASNLVVSKAALALRRMQQVQYDEFAKTGQAPDKYADWAAQWNKQQDPRAYAFDVMGRDAADKMLKGMKPGERAKFDASLSAARRSGLQEGNL